MVTVLVKKLCPKAIRDLEYAQGVAGINEYNDDF